MGECPLCGQQVAPDLLAQAGSLQTWVRGLIQAEHPGWRTQQGVCPDCALVYARRHAVTRSEESIHTQTFPPTTFPFYHPEEAFVLPLPERLPDYPAFTGRGVTLAFVDSGYYPHPDLIDGNSLAVDLSHSNAEVGRTRRLLERQPLRIRQYLNLFEGTEHMGLDSPSLWSDAPSSWHGQMTSAIAVGNGLLSKGRYRGFAPEASLLPIKIGRANGNIPESEVLRALQWLLRDDNWGRYGVRVVNVSVGGDEPGSWWENEVCLAVEELTRRGVLVVTAAGNAGCKTLLAPAQAPSAVTVGGIDDGNRRWRGDLPGSVARQRLYHHNWGEVCVDSWRIAKPDLVAPALWIPAPILPVSAIFREMWVLGRAWEALEQGQVDVVRQLLLAWQTLLGFEPAIGRADVRTLRRALRLRMNPHKFTHAHYQHVDGTSVAAPQVAAVAAQMVQANPALDAYQLKALLRESALPLPHLPIEKVGAGLLLPAMAVAQALRAHGGPLAGYPVSGQRLDEYELRDLAIPVKVAEKGTGGGPGRVQFPCYFGVLAPHACSVHLTGSFNGWRIDDLPLAKALRGWWHGIFLLPPDSHVYRFWIVDNAGDGHWMSDPENPVQTESGFVHPHSVLTV